MNKRFIFWMFLFVLLITGQALAETTIKAEVDRQALSTDEELTYKVIITSSEKQLPAPELPKFEGFSILSQADSSTISFVKGEIKTILVYAVILVPTAPGKFSIGPSTLKLKDKIYSSDSFEIEVTQGKNLPLTPPEERPLLPGHPEAEEPQTTL